MGDSRNSESSFLADGQFTIERHGCMYISLRFRRDGYHDNVAHTYRFRDKEPKVKFEQSPSGETVAKYEDDDSITNGWRVYDNEIIVLKEIGDVGRIEKHEIKLRYDLAKGTDVLDITSLRSQSKEEKLTGYRPERYHKQAGPPDAAPPGSLYIRKVASEEPLPAMMNNLKREITPNDAFLELTLDDPTSSAGFLVVAKLEHADPRGDDTLFSMKEAPESGYNPVLRFTNDYYRNIWRKTYFYFHLNGLYGKGYTQYFEYRQGALLLRMILFVQHDGSRNVRTP